MCFLSISIWVTVGFVLVPLALSLLAWKCFPECSQVLPPISILHLKGTGFKMPYWSRCTPDFSTVVCLYVCVAVHVPPNALQVKVKSVTWPKAVWSQYATVLSSFCLIHAQRKLRLSKASRVQTAWLLMQTPMQLSSCCPVHVCLCLEFSSSATSMTVGACQFPSVSSMVQAHG